MQKPSQSLNQLSANPLPEPLRSRLKPFEEGTRLSTCPVCGEPLETVIDLRGKKVVVPCICPCETKRMEQEDADLKAAKAERIKAARQSSCFAHDAQRKLTFALDDGRGGESMDYARKYADKFTAETDFGLAFFGEPSGGKTFASCCIANELLDRGFSVLFRSMPELIEELSNRETAAYALQCTQSCDLLIIDDLGAERSTSYGQELVYKVVDGRYSARKPMVVSTNLSKADLADRSSRINQRILENCLPIEVSTGRNRAQRSRYDDIRASLNM